VPSGNAREDALDQRRRNQVAHQQPAHFAATRPISTERTRLDLRLSVDLRDQLNDLVARHGVTASEIIRQAVEALWDREIGIVDD
jgi:hypothetical protein